MTLTAEACNKYSYISYTHWTFRFSTVINIFFLLELRKNNLYAPNQVTSCANIFAAYFRYCYAGTMCGTAWPFLILYKESGALPLFPRHWKFYSLFINVCSSKYNTLKNKEASVQILLSVLLASLWYCMNHCSILMNIIEPKCHRNVQAYHPVSLKTAWFVFF